MRPGCGGKVLRSTAPKYRPVAFYRAVSQQIHSSPYQLLDNLQHPTVHGWDFVQLQLPTNHAPLPSPYALRNVGP